MRTGLLQEALLQRAFRDYSQVTVNKQASAETLKCIKLFFHSRVVYFFYAPGDARLLPLHAGSCSEFAALSGSLRGAFWGARVPTLVLCIRLLLPTGANIYVHPVILSFKAQRRFKLGCVL